MAGNGADKLAYRRALEAAYAAAAKRAGVETGEPVLTPRASITGWRITQPSLDGDVGVELLSTAPDGTASAWRITMRWSEARSDWQIVVPTGATAWTKSTTTDSGFSEFYAQ